MASELLAGRYRIGRKIGEGAVAVVYRARDVVADRDVAIKVLRAELASDAQLQARFRREAQAMARLTHPNIVQIYQTGEAGGRPYIVMEYLPEPNFKEILVRYAPLPDRKVAQVGIDCCRALDYAHRQGIVHRDLKPQNILFTAEGIAKLSDFGIAAAVGAPTLSARGTVTGTAAYMAPEQAQGRPATPQSDIYALGCILYEAVTGHCPFEGRSAAEVMRRHVHDRPVPLRVFNPQVSPSLEFIIKKAMAPDPSRRYQSARQMLADLLKVAAGEELDRTGVLSTKAPKTAGATGVPARSGASSVAAPPAVPAPVALVAALLLTVLVIVGVAWVTKQVFYPSRAPILVQVPSVKGLTEGQAREKLSAHRLTVGAIRYAEGSDLYPAGTVIEQRPEMGTTVEAGTAVALVISRGRTLAEVADVVGLTLPEAEERLRKAGLTVGRVEEAYDAHVPAGHVIKQNVAPGTKVESGAAIDLVVGKGPQPGPSPTVQPGPQPTPAPAAQENSQEPGLQPVVPAAVQITDLTPTRGSGEEHVYEIRVTALGYKPQQEVLIRARDASGQTATLWQGRLDPQNTRKVTKALKGTATIEVYHENKLICQRVVPMGAELGGELSGSP
jgi:beta-lactam-binding protein with PASTA domain/tRNA A-37 threonylcarbamoyl transferase component Bud32